MYALLIVVALIVLFPLWSAFTISQLTDAEVATYPPLLWPKQLTLDNFRSALEQAPLARYLLNSVIQSTIVMIGQLVTASLAAYAFAFINFKGRNFLFLVFLSTMMIPWEATIIPNYLTIKSIGWTDTYQGLAAPFLATAFGTFLLRQFFLTLPKELHDAAIIDGSGDFRFLTTIVVPLARPGPRHAGRLQLPADLQPVPVAAPDHQQPADAHRADRHRAAAGPGALHVQHRHGRRRADSGADVHPVHRWQPPTDSWSHGRCGQRLAQAGLLLTVERREKMKRSLWSLLCILVVLSMVLSACGAPAAQPPAQTGGQQPAATQPPAATQAPAAAATTAPAAGATERRAHRHPAAHPDARAGASGRREVRLLAQHGR